jgi:hypothetical protein
MPKLEDLFCEDLFGAFLSHLRICQKCRTGTRELIKVPLVGMMLPGDKKKAFIEALEQLEKESPS